MPAAEIVTAYEAGASSTTLAAKYGTTQHAILKLLRDNGATIRTKGGWARVYRDGFTEELATLYASGMTIQQIAERLGIGFGSVRRGLAAGGVQSRPHGLRKASIIVPTDVATLAYFAGLLDGEGNLQVKVGTNGRSYVACRLAIYNTNRALMDWLVERFGGVAVWRDNTYSQERGWLPAGKWQVYRARDVQAILSAVLPYLIIKRGKAEMMLGLFAEVFGLHTAPLTE